MDTPSPEEMQRLLAENDLVVVDYYATWCLPCKAYTPKFQRLEREVRRTFPDAKVAFVSIDIDRDHAEAKRGRVQSVPTTIAWQLRKGLFGPKRRERLRFSGDRPWNDLVLTFTDLVRSL